ncbi:cytochrome P450 [Micromonospora sp. CPCC 206061]|uniref:cytochrome P450 n=1 Tax=Micromonospora sp. CPCC 206061 TaxID=3122410 RepID=UPI002FF3EB0F
MDSETARPFDPTDPQVVADPYPTYERLRAAGPVVRASDPGVWAVSRYDDVARLARDPRLRNEFPPRYHHYSVGEGEAAAFLQRIVLNRDPPEHTRLRRLMARGLSPSAVGRLREHVTRVVDELLDPALDSGEVDLASGVALPLPVMVVCEMLGVADADRDETSRRAATLVHLLGMIRPTPQQLAESGAALAWLRDYLGGLIRQYRRRPQPNELSAMVGAADPALSEEEIVDNAVFLLLAGFETTMGFVTNGLAALLDRPEAVARLRAEPGLLPSTVEELLRFDPSVQWVARYVAEPLRVGGTLLRRNRVVLLLLASANRDGRRFADPDRLDVGRHPNPHLTFGGGAHHCMGAGLARLEGQVLLQRLLARTTALEIGGRSRRRHPSLRTFDRLVLHLQPA